MNSRHLPAGQAVDGGGAAGAGMSPGASPGQGIAPGVGPGPSPGPRRGGRLPPYQQHYNGGHHQHHHHQQQQQQHMPVYTNYMNPYPAYGYPHGAQIPPPYQNGAQYQPGGMPSQAYMPYAHYGRSPPAMHQYVPMMGAGGIPHQQPQPQPHTSQNPYSRNQQQSPIVVSTPYQTPPSAPRGPSHNHAPVVQSVPLAQAPPPHVSTPPTQPSSQPAAHAPPPAAAQASTPQPSAAAPSAAPALATPASPSSTHSTQTPTAAPPLTPPTPQTVDTPVEQVPSPKHQPLVKLSSPKAPFKAPLPWYTHPDIPFPSRTNKTKRRRRIFAPEAEALKLPSKTDLPAEVGQAEHRKDVAAVEGAVETSATTSKAGVVASEPRPATPVSQDPTSTSPPTPASTKATTAIGTPAPTKSAKSAHRAAVPAVPIVPVLPKVSPKTEKHAAPSTATATTDKVPAEGKIQSSQAAESHGEGTAGSDPVAAQAEPKPKPSAVPGAPGAPLLWTGLFNKPVSSSTNAAGTLAGQVGSDDAAGADLASTVTRGPGASSFAQSNASSLAEALRAYRVGNGEKVHFIEPRGLINTGNMCYMNSVLQVLIFCIPFYDFLDQAGKKVMHSFKSETPLIDAMIEFMRDFKVIDSAVSVDQLRRRLKSEELEQYGEPFTPEFVYEAIRKLPRFSSMRRGHQQDAEEFLGFLLESLHDECAQVMRTAPASSNASTAPNSSVPTPTASVHSAMLDGGDSNNMWLEVGPRQRAAITRSSGHSDTSSPVTKIFGGQLRSELRVPGLKDSVTLEPYQPLQLDIGSPNVRNIVDALRGLTNPESLRGDFNSPRGKDVTATKQVFIESLPPVLILHLKRFQFDAEGNGTVKIWKKVGYPLELEIPREVFSRSKRNSGAGLPKYRLTAVVYHHGKNASGGHYTVDVRRQDDHEWIRLDDTVIRRIRSEDVAEGGSEEDTSRISSSEAGHSARKEAGGSPSSGTGAAPPANRFAGMTGEDETGDEDGWRQVSGGVPGPSGGKKWSSIVNGGTGSTASGASASSSKAGRQQHLAKDNIKDKVAYLLFYQRI